MKKDTIVVFTDGASRGNPGAGGWGALVVDATIGKMYELGGREDNTTNNRMEMMAAREALNFIEQRELEGDPSALLRASIEINTDSAYLLNGITRWVFGWEKNGWKTKTGEPVLNQDLWRDISALNFRLGSKRTVEWNKVSGHSGLRGNERVDEIATKKADREQILLFVGSVNEYEKLIGGNIFDVTATTTKTKKKSASAGKKAYSYISIVDGKISVDKDWATCEKRVKGKSKTKFKKVFSLAEEKSLVAEWKNLARM